MASTLKPESPLVPQENSTEESSLGEACGSGDESEETDAPEGKTANKGGKAGKSAPDERKVTKLNSADAKQMVPRDSWGDEAWDILTVGGPMCAAGIGRCLQMMGLQSVLGNLDTKVLAAVSVAGIWTNVMETMLQAGMGQVVTLSSQAFGAKNYRLVATWCHITFVWVTICAIPVTMMRWFTADVLMFLGVDEEEAQLAGLFTFYAQSVLVFELWYHTFRTYFAAQTIVIPDAIINFVFVFVWYASAYTAVNILDGGIVGAALAQASAWVLQCVCFVGLSFYMGYHKKTWYTPDPKEIFVASRWKTLTGQLVPAGISGLLEQLQLQSVMLIAARVSETLAASQTLTSTLSMLCFMFAFGASGGTGIRVGRFLGEGRAEAAKFTAWSGSALVCGCNVGWGLLAALILPTYARAASNDPAVWKEIDGTRWVTGLAIAMLGSFVVMANVIMKQGRPHIVGLCVPVCTWFMGIPTSYYLAPKWGLVGIWTGTLVGYGSAFIVLSIAFCKSDWEYIAAQAASRAEVVRRSNSNLAERS